MKDFVNWAVLAPGNIANAMARAMNSPNEKIRRYAVASRDAGRAESFAGKYGFEKSYGSYEELLSDPQVDAVYVSNPHAFHFDSVMKCLESGKHVLCEKPAGCNGVQLNQMIEKARSKNLFFMEAMWTAFNPCIGKIKECIANGAIGNVLHVLSYFCNKNDFDPKSRLWAPEMAGGALLDVGIYNIYFSMLMNDFVPAVNYGSNVRFQNSVDAWESVSLVFENRVTATFESAVGLPFYHEEHDAFIYGSKGFIKVKDFFMAQKAEIHLYPSRKAGSKRTEIIEAPFRVNGYEYELEEATECILNGKTESSVYPHRHSVQLCGIMDDFRRKWNFKYPFEE